MTREIERCWAMGNKVIFRTKGEAERVLRTFRADHNGHGKIVKCFPHDHWHLTKNRKVGKGKTLKPNRSGWTR